MFQGPLQEIGIKRCGNEWQSWANLFAKIQVASKEESRGNENGSKENCEAP